MKQEFNLVEGDKTFTFTLDVSRRNSNAALLSSVCDAYKIRWLERRATLESRSVEQFTATVNLRACLDSLVESLYLTLRFECPEISFDVAKHITAKMCEVLSNVTEVHFRFANLSKRQVLIHKAEFERFFGITLNPDIPFVGYNYDCVVTELPVDSDLEDCSKFILKDTQGNLYEASCRNGDFANCSNLVELKPVKPRQVTVTVYDPIEQE
jgi:hypothetical protein